MNRDKVLKVRELATEVAELCGEVDRIEQENDTIRESEKYQASPHAYYMLKPTGVANAALKRRSLDLTRALADMRKP